MKTRCLPWAGLLLLCCCGLATGASHSSTDYTIISDTLDAAGGKSAASSYAHQGSVGGLVGGPTSAPGGIVAQSGYVRELYEIIGLTPPPRQRNSTNSAAGSSLPSRCSTITRDDSGRLRGFVECAQRADHAHHSGGDGEGHRCLPGHAATVQGTYQAHAAILGSR